MTAPKPKPKPRAKSKTAAKSKSKVTKSKVTKRRTGVRPLPLSGAEPKYSWEPWGSIGKVHDNCYDYAFGSFSKSRTMKSVPGARAHIGSDDLNFRTCKGIVYRILKDNPGMVVKHMKNPCARCPPGYYKVMCFVAPSNDFGNSTGDFHFLKQIGGVRYRTNPGDTVLGLAAFFKVHPATIMRAARGSTAPVTPNDGRFGNTIQDLKVLNMNNERHNKSLKILPGRIIEFPVNLWAHKQGWAGGPLMTDASSHVIVDPRKCDMNYTPGFHYTRFCSAWAVKRGMAKTGANNNR